MKRYYYAINQQPSTLPYYRLGETYMALEQIEQAKKAYETCLEINSQFTVVHFKLAEIYAMEENISKEQYHMLQAMKQDPLGVNMEQLAQLSVENQLHEELLSELLKLTGRVAEMWRLDALAYVYGAAGDSEKEQELVEEALQMDKEHPEVIFHYAKVLAKQRNPKAISLVTSVMKRDIHNERAFELYVQVMEQQRKLPQIRDALHLLPITKQERSFTFMYTATAIANRFAEKQQNEQPKKSIFTRAFYRVKNRAKEIYSLTMVINLFEISLKLNTKNSLAAQRLAEFYENGNMIAEAIEVLQTSLENVWDFDVAQQFATLLLNHGDGNEDMIRDALRLTKQMLQEQPHHYDVLVLQSHALFELGDEKKQKKSACN